MLDKLGYLATGLGLSSIAASVAAWYKEKTDDDAENAHAERTGIFIGLWPQTFFALAILFFKLREMGHEKDAERLVERMEEKVNEIRDK